MRFEMTGTNNWRETLRAELAARNVKITVLSQELGFHRDYISNVLADRGTEPSIERVRRICEATGVDFAALFKPIARDDRERAVLRKIQLLDDDDLDRALKLIEALYSE